VLECFNNRLTNLDLSQNLKLEFLDISDNNFAKQDLSFLSHLNNLKVLSLGNDAKFYCYKEIRDKIKKNIQQGICNQFTGSLEPLKNMTKLKSLDISNTDVSSGVEYLPNNMN
jgi:hypothetical protein